MDSMSAFARGQASRNDTPMVFDWVTAASILRDSKAVMASAGLRDDWEYTGGDILSNGLPVRREDTYTYLASTWATPELAYKTEDGQEFLVDCFKLAPELPGYDADTYWPSEALAEFGIIEGESYDTTIQKALSNG
jgi:hypothetical protein